MRVQSLLLFLLALLAFYLAFAETIRKPAFLGIPVANALFGAAGTILLVAATSQVTRKGEPR